MSEIAALHPVVRAWLLEGPLSSHVPSYVARLRRGRYLRIIERLLLYTFADRPVVLGELQPEDVRRFIANQLESLGSISNATTIAATLRAYPQRCT